MKLWDLIIIIGLCCMVLPFVLFWSLDGKWLKCDAPAEAHHAKYLLGATENRVVHFEIWQPVAMLRIPTMMHVILEQDQSIEASDTYDLLDAREAADELDYYRSCRQEFKDLLSRERSYRVFGSKSRRVYIVEISRTEFLIYLGGSS